MDDVEVDSSDLDEELIEALQEVLAGLSTARWLRQPWVRMHAS